MSCKDIKKIALNFRSDISKILFKEALECQTGLSGSRYVRFQLPSQGSSPKTDNKGNYKAKNCWNLSSSIPHFKSIWIQEAESVFLLVSERVLLIVGQIIHKSCTRLAIYGSYFCLFIILLNLFPHSDFVVKTCVAKNHVRGLKVKAKQDRYILYSNPS